MNIDIIFASYIKDGLFYYSYEHFRYLNDNDIRTNFYIFLRGRDTKEDCLELLNSKYQNVTLDNIFFIDNFSPLYRFKNKILLMGKSHIHHAYNMCQSPSYSNIFKLNLINALRNHLVIIHNENFLDSYENEIQFFRPLKVTHLNDHLIYPNFDGIQYRKKIYFDIYKQPAKELNCTLFNGTNQKYFDDILPKISKYKNPIILVDKFKCEDYLLFQVKLPVEDLLEKFNRYVYTKSFFDPAPRLIQECFYFNKDVIYDRDFKGVDGGYIYYQLGMNGENFNLTNEILEILNDS